MLNKFLRKLQDKETVIGIVGLPLILSFVKTGFTVIGFDVDEEKTDQLNRGRSFIKHIAAEEIQLAVDKKLFTATTDFSRASEADALNKIDASFELREKQIYSTNFTPKNAQLSKEKCLRRPDPFWL